MNKLVFTLFAVAASVVCADAARDRQLARTGGVIERPQNGKVIRIVNCQSRIDAKVIDEFAQSARGMLSLAVESARGDPAKCYATERDPKVGFCYLIADDAKCPFITTAAPEDGFAQLNIARLAADNPLPEKLLERTRKELWRGLVYGLGGGNNTYPGCIMIPAVGIEGIDAIQGSVPCPAPFNSMIDTGILLGISRIGSATYRQACKEGWAPAPTNDFQKVIWDEVNAKPTKPVTIKYDKNRGK